MYFWRVHLKRIKDALASPTKALLSILWWAVKIGILLGIGYAIKSTFGGVPTMFIGVFLAIIYLEHRIGEAEYESKKEIRWLKEEIESLQYKLNEFESDP